MPDPFHVACIQMPGQLGSEPEPIGCGMRTGDPTRSELIIFCGPFTQRRPIELANTGLADCHPVRMAGALPGPNRSAETVECGPVSAEGFRSFRDFGVTSRRGATRCGWSGCVALTALEVVAALVPGAALARLALPRAVLCGAFSARAAGPRGCRLLHPVLLKCCTLSC